MISDEQLASWIGDRTPVGEALQELQRRRRADQLYQNMLETGNAAMRRQREEFQVKWGKFYRCRTCGDRVEVTPGIESGTKTPSLCECETKFGPVSSFSYRPAISAIEFERRYRRHSYSPPGTTVPAVTVVVPQTLHRCLPCSECGEMVERWFMRICRDCLNKSAT